jgi:3-oxoacyl-[acyl-carrier-protein] synthase-3
MATGRGIPERVMTNHDFASMGIETSHDWIVERSGIVERHIALWIVQAYIRVSSTQLS